MRAIVFERYGSPEVLELRDVATPTPARGEVLVEVVAVSINLSDWESLHGTPAYARIGGLFRPRRTILGSDIAGRVVAVGDGVTRFHVGDEIFGDNLPRNGGFAEYVAMPASALAPKPAALSFAEASAVPQAGVIASQAVALAEPGSRMLINGGGGGSGSFAIQLAVAKGVEVTAVDNAGKLDFMRQLGAHRVIDYRAEDFTRTGPYDVIVDLVAHRSVFAYRRALAKGGRCVMVGGTARTMVRMLTIGGLLGLATGVRLGVLMVREGPAHFAAMAEQCAAGSVSICIDRVFGLKDAPAALAWHGEGRALGKVVVAVGDAGRSPD
ncbi:NAD(P)-dependent alcohol dehydrogenase [Microbacterium sp. CFBP9034]|uniref:NAD(P)-dependent alcohol dehydrogenase n=1 Tax=Microbacterium sp. CFBP9034 TaxID=3096540 RepID=UPI002A6B0353|nr:NAD(P)-dependent alcohol dehydrogenase [Microbacterium sp. CFBP9034]MDY0910677.1 NAD(P)-dependent alcohol dehydrogenase [Microbacterium sp. CFBP9034]